MSKKASLTLAGIAILLGLLILVYARDLANELSPKEPLQRLPQVATALKADGPVTRRPNNQSISEPLTTGQSIHHQDRIIVDRLGTLQLSFDSGYEIQLIAPSEIVVEYWSADGLSSPAYINVIHGDYKVLKKGILGQLYVVMNREVFVPSVRPRRPTKPFVISQLKSASQDKPEIAAPVPPSESPTEEDTNPAPSVAVDQVAAPAQLETLTDSYITEVIAGQKEGFSRCQANAIRDNKPATGQLLFGVTIEPRGVIEEVKVLESNVNNPELEQCVSTVFTRARFKAFTGIPIKRSFPLNFE